MLSHQCELKELKNSLIKDILIRTNNPYLQSKLQSETDLTLEFAIKAGQTAEATRRQVDLLQRKPKEVNFTKSEKKSLPQVKKSLRKLTLTKGRTPFSNREKNKRIQILFILTLTRQLPHIQSNLQHLQKTQPFCKNVLLKQTH